MAVGLVAHSSVSFDPVTVELPNESTGTPKLSGGQPGPVNLSVI